VLLLAGCAGKAKQSDIGDGELRRALDELDSRVAIQHKVGPTQLEGTNHFVDRTESYGLANVEAVAFYAVDLNRDTHPDLVVLPGYYSQPRFFLFDPATRRFDQTGDSPFSETVSAGLMSFADFNRDGVPDVVVGVLNQRGEFSKIPVSLWYGAWDKGLLRFQRAADFPVLPAEPTSAFVISDVDLDGRLDLFIGNWFQDHKGSVIPSADRLLVNTSEGWVDRSDWLQGERDKSTSDLYPPKARPTYAASSCDMDQDGFPDILTASSSGYANKLWLNRAPRPGPTMEGRRFEDVGPASGYAADAQGLLVPTGGGRTFSTVCADYNDDGIMDVFLGELTHSWDPLSADRSSVLTGARPTLPLSFLRTEYMSDGGGDNWNQGDKRAQWSDFNLDGLVDLLVDNSGFPPTSRLVAFRQDDTRAFVNVAAEWGVDLLNPLGSITLDLNLDGRLDIITAQSNVRQANIKNRVWVLENQLATTGRAYVFHLDGEAANEQGLGAMVMLYTLKGAQQVVQRRWNELVQGGLPSQNPPGVHFGVDEEAKLVGVKVRWPILRRERRPQRPLERLYPLKGNGQARQEWTLCEDGRALPGRLPCLAR